MTQSLVVTHFEFPPVDRLAPPTDNGSMIRPKRLPRGANERAQQAAKIAILLALFFPMSINARPKDHVGLLKVTDDQYKTGKGWYVGGAYVPQTGSRGIIVWDNGTRCDAVVVVFPHLSKDVWKVYADKNFTKIFVEESAEPAKGKSLPRTKTELIKLDSFSTCSPEDVSEKTP